MSSFLPGELLASLRVCSGFDEADFERVHRTPDQVVSVRLNPLKCPFHMKEDESFPAGFSFQQKVSWSSFGYYLSGRPNFTFDPLLHAGAYYVQEASSMFLEQAMRQTVDLSRPLKILDCCAAPGGKSTLVQSIISKNSLLLSNEVIKSRVNILSENLVKWGPSNVMITQNDPKHYSLLQNYFDIIIVDAPCSGSGLFRRDPSVIRKWSQENVQLCSRRQERILSAVWPALKQEGILIYSTCSFSKDENEDILDGMLQKWKAFSLRLKTDQAWHVIETFSDKCKALGYRFYPDKLKGEGFFIACLQKKEGGSYSYQKTKITGWEKLNKQEERIVEYWISSEEPLRFLKRDEAIYAFPAELLPDLFLLQSSHLYLRKAGVLLGKMADGTLLPSHELALSLLIHPQIPRVGLEKEQALHYLRKEEIRPDCAHKGWVLVQYSHQNLGWIKILDHRVNNYYPKEWRILKTE